MARGRMRNYKKTRRGYHLKKTQRVVQANLTNDENTTIHKRPELKEQMDCSRSRSR